MKRTIGTSKFCSTLMIMVTFNITTHQKLKWSMQVGSLLNTVASVWEGKLLITKMLMQNVGNSSEVTYFLGIW